MRNFGDFVEKSERCTEVTLLDPKGSVIDIYTKRYLELVCRFYDLFEHDLKNHQNAIFMAMDLYRLKGEAKYLDMVEEASQKSLEQINAVKKIESLIFSGGEPGFYSFFACINAVKEKYPDIGFELQGDDIYVFADAAFPKFLDLIIQMVPEPYEKIKYSFVTSEFQENGLNKCKVEVTIHDFTVPGNTAESILNGDTNSVTGDMMSLIFYIGKMMLCRYSGSIRLAESGENKTKLDVTFLKYDNPVFSVTS